MPSATPSTKPSMVVASVCRMCGHSTQNFATKVSNTCDGRGRIRSDMPDARQNTSQPTKNSTISTTELIFCRTLSMSVLRCLGRDAACIDDEVAQALVDDHELGIERQRDGARARERDPAVVEDAARPRAHH